MINMTETLSGPECITKNRPYLKVKLDETKTEKETKTLKKCSICQENKPLTEYYKDNNSPDGKGYWCKKCTRLNAQERKKKREQKNNKGENMDPICP
jgi:hypothetical protein